MLIWSKSLTLLFGYFQQDKINNYKIEFLARRLGTRLHFGLFISFHPNFNESEIYIVFCNESRNKTKNDLQKILQYPIHWVNVLINIHRF